VIKSCIMEVEALNYWISSCKLNALYRLRTPALDDIEDAKAELEAMAMHTDWHRLHDLCNAALDEDLPLPNEDVA
jgi:hypothetical protein